MTDQVDLDIDENQRWTCCAEDIPSSEILFGTQVFLVYVVVFVCLANITLGNEPHDLWVALLSSSIGYILPSPSLTKS